jgi:nitrate reductase delta subunit
VTRFAELARALAYPEADRELQAEYVETFDFDRRASLHLTYHVHGDRRQRGLELIRLKRRYAEAGLELADGELPDYLPVLLEFADLRPDEGRSLLAEHRPALELVRARLHERGSRWAAVLDEVVAALPPLTRAQAERARRLAEEGPPTELVGLEPSAA